MDSGGNQDEPSMEVSKELDLDSSKDDSTPGLPTLNKTPKPNHKVPPSLPIDPKESPLLPAKPLSNLTKKQHYNIILAEKAELKKKIIGNIKE